MLSRRTLLLVPIAAMAARTASAAGKMTLAIHQNTSAGSGYRESLEGWARAGIKHVELTNTLLDGFLKNDTLAAARRVLTDLGLTPVCAACGVTGLWEPNPKRAAALESFRKRCEMFRELGLTRIYSPTGTNEKFTEDDYRTGADNMRWSGLSKLEDLDLIRPREIGHVHFQDVPDIPRELLDSTTRFIPGDGIAPLTRILRKLADKEYSGALSVELFLPRFQKGDPYEVAREVRQKSEAVMRRARVM
jgi:sugar phosphate isomerase/epimerase